MESRLTTIPEINMNFVRNEFPSLNGQWRFFDNAGGTQVLKKVVERISDYLLSSNVQPGASYGTSLLSTERIKMAQKGVASFLNAEYPNEVVMGPSATMMFRILSICLGKTLTSGDEIIVTNTEHEANVGAWMALQDQGVKIKVWSIRPETMKLHLDDLEPLFSSRTKLLTMTHASNVTGTINPIKEIAKIVHDHNAMIAVDGVAYAPHRAVDVIDLDVDFYVASFYKFFGPHYSIMYGKKEHWERIPGINHYFIDGPNYPYKYQPGNVNFELSYGALGILDYLDEFATVHYGEEGASDNIRGRIEQSFDVMSRHEEKIGSQLIDFLNSKKNVKIIGEKTGDENLRVPTISFHVDQVPSSLIPLKVDEAMIGIRYGDFYAKRLMKALDINEEGIVRVSMAHYNTSDEVSDLIQALDKLF